MGLTTQKIVSSAMQTSLNPISEIFFSHMSPQLNSFKSKLTTKVLLLKISLKLPYTTRNLSWKNGSSWFGQMLMVSKIQER